MNIFTPISLLYTFNKILEKLVRERLVNFIAKYNILYVNQFGFREKIFYNACNSSYYR